MTKITTAILAFLALTAIAGTASAECPAHSAQVPSGQQTADKPTGT